ncbi:MAG: DUF1697 domain-containing protein, partial [Acidobacteria bacterium]|nr:DUF1697 domain-containing protein [Acidobacteriota bacterium]
ASGNVIFDATGQPGQIEATIETTLNAALGYAVATMVRSTAEIAGVVRRVEAQKLDPGGDVTLYVGFLKTAPTARVARATAAMSNEVDVLVVHGRCTGSATSPSGNRRLRVPGWKRRWRGRPRSGTSTPSGGWPAEPVSRRGFHLSIKCSPAKIWR